MIAGHSHPSVMAAVRAQLEHGLGYGAPTEIETRLAQKVCELVPSVERVRINAGGIANDGKLHIYLPAR